MNKKIITLLLCAAAAFPAAAQGQHGDGDGTGEVDGGAEVVDEIAFGTGVTNFGVSSIGEGDGLGLASVGRGG